MCNTVFRKIPLKASPSKKSRGGGQGGLRRAPTLGAPTPLSHSTGQQSIDSRIVYYPHFKSTESEGEAGVQSDRPDLVPRTPPPTDNPADAEANLSTSSVGSTGVTASSPRLRSVGVEVHKSENTDQVGFHSFAVEEAANVTGNSSGNEDVVSLSDVLPETNC